MLAGAARHGDRDWSDSAVGPYGAYGHRQSGHQSQLHEFDPLAKPLACGAAELDLLPERLRRPCRQPGDADRPVHAGKSGHGIRCRVVHHRLRRQCAHLTWLFELAPDVANVDVVRLLRVNVGLSSATHARAVTRRIREALDFDRAYRRQLYEYSDG